MAWFTEASLPSISPGTRGQASISQALSKCQEIWSDELVLGLVMEILIFFPIVSFLEDIISESKLFSFFLL